MHAMISLDVAIFLTRLFWVEVQKPISLSDKVLVIYFSFSYIRVMH